MTELCMDAADGGCCCVCNRCARCPAAETEEEENPSGGE